MFPVALHFAACIAAAVAAASVAYCLLCSLLGVRFAQASGRALKDAKELPPISILKPIKGADPDLYEALTSHCVQDYPGYEIIFGITDPNDPALRVIEKLKRGFPQRSIRIVGCEQRLGANGKVSTLAQMVPLSRNEILLVNDSDIRVGPNYLRNIAGELQRPGVGVVTCLYRGTPRRDLWSRLEALGISTDFIPGVLAAQLIDGRLRFALGSTLAFRKSDLAEIGGFESLVDYLADDYELGHRISERGSQVALSTEIVETHLPAYDLRGYFSHQLRWARTIRVSRPAGYAGLIFTFTLPWAILTVVLARGASWSWWLLAASTIARFIMAAVSARVVLRDKVSVQTLWLLPLRDFFAAVVWIFGLAGRRIVWRGEVFTLHKGKLNRAESSASSA